MASARVIRGHRRFTCLSPTLVRMEFAPDGVFEARPSLVAHAPQQPRKFAGVHSEGNDTLLDTGAMTIVTRQDDDAFFPANLEVRWLHDGLLQYWRPGDRDYRNLGGTVRSLDCYANVLGIQGVHAADMETPDSKANEWLVWLRCEDDPSYYAKSPDQRPGLNTDFYGSVRYNLRQLLARTHNYTVDQLKFSPGLLSRSGYFFLNDSVSPVMDADDFPVARRRPGYQDWYFFAYGADYAQALRDFVLVSGRALLPTRNTFGLMFCRWPAPDHVEAKQIVEEFRKQGTPLSTMIIDMEWHKEGWGHWDWDPKTYPDPGAFFRWCHEQGLQVSLNDHPLDVRADDSHFEPYLRQAGTVKRVRHAEYNGKKVDMIDVNIGDKREARAFLDVCHTHIVKQGLDFWWNDGCKGRLDGAINQLVCNKLMFEEVRSPQNRGMLLARYGGLGSHRYGVFFTGDTLSCWEVLKTQCEFNIRAGHLGLGYVSHDIGGFFMSTAAPLLDPELFVRWVQFGVFSPVFRFHSAPGSGSRKPWDYGEQICGILKRWLRVRNSLIPYIYTAARKHHDTGYPLVRGLFFDRPDDEAAQRFDAYWFGPDLVVAPLLAAGHYRSIQLPPGNWFRFETANRVTGGTEFVERQGLGGIPVFVRAGSVLVRQDVDAGPGTAHVEKLWLDVYPGADGHAELYEDDGVSPRFEKGECCRTRFDLHADAGVLTLRGAVTGGKPLGEEREITVDLSLERAPVRVTLNGGKPLAVEELKSAGRWRVQLSRRAAAKPFVLRVHL